MTEPVSICRYRDVELTPERVAEIDRIFFESSNTKTFPSDAARATFRERWLGRYLKHDAAFAYMALDGEGRIIGYLVGAVDDPASASRFADISYFTALSSHTKLFPAHLHVNISPEFRNRGIGGRLIDGFLADAKAAGAAGVHVVTSTGAANVSFYNRKGFEEIARAGTDNDLVFLARSV